MRMQAVENRELAKQKRAILRYLRDQELKKREEAAKAEKVLSCVIKIQACARMYLARKELRRLKTEKEQAHYDMEYADEVATKCLESILGYSLSTY
jgi:hypothetical protein